MIHSFACQLSKRLKHLDRCQLILSFRIKYIFDQAGDLVNVRDLGFVDLGVSACNFCFGISTNSTNAFVVCMCTS